MRRRPALLFPIVVGSMVIATGTGLLFQRLEQRTLEAELIEARRTESEINRLRAENAALRARGIPAAELERLRADHAALPRLRAELQSLQQRAATKSP